jgi:predicted transport protein
MQDFIKILILIVILIIFILINQDNNISKVESQMESQIESQMESQVKIPVELSQYKKFSASTPYADVVFFGNNSRMYINIKYKNLSGVSAIHIHVNNKGKPGPNGSKPSRCYNNNSGVSHPVMPCITERSEKPKVFGPVLAWMGTTIQWQRGVAQTNPNGNSPCCTKNNPLCILASPPNIGTPYLSSALENTEKTFVFYNEYINGGCPWINNGTLLDIHGFNFQENINGKLTDKKPGADIIYQSEFLQISR